MNPLGARHIDGPTLATLLPIADAIDTLERSLLDGLDPAADPPRGVVTFEHGHLLVMPSQGRSFAGIKIASVAPGNAELGRPRVQALYLLMDAETLTPLAILDGAALTSLRTPAVSAVAARQLARTDASRVVVFGAGPQAAGHIAALRAVRPVTEVVVVGRDAERARALVARVSDHASARLGRAADVAGADIVVCATTAERPLFDGSLVSDGACVLAIGGHEAHVREIDGGLVGRSFVVVEDVATARREAGDIVLAIDDGDLDPADVVGLADLVTGRLRPPALGPPRLFKGVGMGWQDLVIAQEIYLRANR